MVNNLILLFFLIVLVCNFLYDKKIYLNERKYRIKYKRLKHIEMEIIKEKREYLHSEYLKLEKWLRVAGVIIRYYKKFGYIFHFPQDDFIFDYMK